MSFRPHGPDRGYPQFLAGAIATRTSGKVRVDNLDQFLGRRDPGSSFGAAPSIMCSRMWSSITSAMKPVKGAPTGGGELKHAGALSVVAQATASREA